ncbi:beta strand repeat-containing protein [Zobellella sp. An-6]|uniref:beta strand repeat-containing protein n=1 Tax=Zobellella sp. An-6 TaxID=3400218 RepID=UPI004041F22C
MDAAPDPGGTANGTERAASFTYTVTDTDGLTDTATLTITIDGRNDAPLAVDDSATAIEAGGTANGTTGSNASGNVLSNDLDVDGEANGETATVTAIRTGAESGSGDSGTVGAALAGQYGSLTLDADGTYSYVVDESNAAVQALRVSGQILSESFTYTVTDTDGLTDTATLTITIDGRNDAPLAVDDSATAVEAGGTANGSSGSDASGNVLSNDLDVDSVANGETATVTAVRTGAEGGVGDSGTVGAALAGQYGSLTLNADGTYNYVIDESNAAVQALRVSGQTLSESFTYTVTDADGLTDTATLTITIDGRNDAPLAVDDGATAVEAGGTANGTTGSDASGNVLSNDSDVDDGDSKTVTAIRTGAESGSGDSGTIGVALAGQYGSLTLNADGTYSYVVDESNAAVQALRVSGQTLSDTFTYTMSDTAGLTDSATLTITIDGRNDAPLAVDDGATAIEAGGTANGTAGSNASGNVLTNDSDVDGEANGETATVTAVRTGAEGGAGDSGTVGAALAGRYGSLTLNADGSYSYMVDESNAAVQALRVSGQTLSESFTYTVTDADGLSDTATLTITIDGRNDAPLAVDDGATAIEAGGVANGTAGSDASGNVLTNDSDVDGEANGETATVTAIRTGAESGSGDSGTVGAALVGQYGSLTLNADGTYNYVIDESNAAVQALRVSGQTLSESFTYTVTDADGLSDTATLTITLDGRNDAPLAVDDNATAIEAGGVANGSSGSDASGNVLSNDLDVDSVANGETATVTAVRTGAESGSGDSGTVGAALAGQYGSLTLNADGTYNYVIDESNAAVQALRVSGQTLSDTFTYTMSDTAGLTDSATLTITIDGRNDAPLAVDDNATAVEAGGTANGTAGSDASGNVLTNDSDVDGEANGETATVTAIRTGAESGSGDSGTVGAALVGQYGSLTLNADGTYNYVIDESNAAVQALRVSGQTLSDTFTYTMSDTAGLTDSATLTITIDGRNDAPLAVDDNATAVEAGGTANGTAGSDASGNVLTNDSDVDGEANGETATVTAIRTGAESGSGDSGTVGAALVGQYGSLTLNADGTYNYVIDESNAAVQALRVSGQTLSESFTYTVTDADGLSDTATLTITLDGRNDAPLAVDDSATAVEAGGTANGSSGSDGSGNVLSNDLDVDSVANGETATVTAVRTGAESGSGDSGTVGAALAGQYGSLTLNADGTYNYVIDESNAAVQALRQSGQTLSESFTYTVTDADGLTDTATLTITIDGRNDAPLAVDDGATAIEAGGTANGTVGSNASGNVLSNDLDVDSVANGETATVTAVRTGAEGGAGDSGTVGAALAGRYGSLTLNADGSYSYVVDESNAAVQALRVSGQTLSESFTYTVTDTDGLTDTATLTITIDGRNDAPLAVDDSATAVEAGGTANGSAGSDASGNVLTNDSDVDGEANGETATVSAIRTGAEGGVGDSGTVGVALAGQYGSLTLNADGSYSYVVDESNAAVQALRVSGQTLSESFTYRVMDAAGLTDSATLTITIDGRNDAPVALTTNINEKWNLGKDYRRDISALFADADSALYGEDLDFLIQGLPSGLSYNPATGVISGKPAEVGKFVVTLTAVDKAGASVSRDYLLEILAPPQETPVSRSTVNTDVPPPRVDNTRVTNDLSPLPQGLVRQDGNTDPAAGVGFVATPAQGQTETLLLSANNALVVQIRGTDGNVTTRASVDVSVSETGEVVFTEVQRQAFDAVALSVSGIVSTADNRLTIDIVDAKAGQGQVYVGTLADGSALPDWITIDPQTGNVTVSSPGQLSELAIRIQAVGSDGQVRVLEIKLDVDAVLRKQATAEPEQPTAALPVTGFVPLAEQLAAEVDAMEGYGNRLLTMLSTV